MNIQNLNYSKRAIINNPNIIKSRIDYAFENYLNTPKLVLVIENKTILKEELNTLSIDLIDYNDLNPLSTRNIFNFFNRRHGELIKTIEHSEFSVNNHNFAYHYFIDKKGNIYEGRPHNIKAYNLDIFDYDPNENYKNHELPRLSNSNSIFEDCLIILTEENTDTIDTTNATYSALTSLLIYLNQYHNYKKFYGYSELKNIPFKCVKYNYEDLTRFNNPGVFFRINELHSSVEKNKIIKSKTEFNITTYTYGERVLTYMAPNYMNGNDVIMLQKMLYKLELLNKYEYITGVYDKNTSDAVKSLQEKYYIKPEIAYGVADKNTLKTLRNQIYKKKMDNIKTIDDEYNPTRILEYIEGNNMMGYDVTILQKKLKQVSMPLNVTGIFDEKTKEAVRFFQIQNEVLSNSYITDGKVGPATWKEIFNTKENIFVLESDSPIEGAITPTTSTISKKYILKLQKAINKILSQYGMDLPLTGGYDEETQKYISLINKNEYNRKVIGLDAYDDVEGIDWNDDKCLKTCYPIEYIYLIKHYLLKEDYNIELITVD